MVKTYNGNTGLQSERMVMEMLMDKYPQFDWKPATRDQQINHDIDIVCMKDGKEVMTLSVKEAKRAKQFGAFAYETHESKGGKEKRNSWGILGQATDLVIIYHDEVVVYKYKQLKDHVLNGNFQLATTRASTQDKVAECGRVYTTAHLVKVPVRSMEPFVSIRFKLGA